MFHVSQIQECKYKFALVVRRKVCVGSCLQSKLDGKDLWFDSLDPIKLVRSNMEAQSVGDPPSPDTRNVISKIKPAHSHTHSTAPSLIWFVHTYNLIQEPPHHSTLTTLQPHFEHFFCIHFPTSSQPPNKTDLCQKYATSPNIGNPPAIIWDHWGHKFEAQTCWMLP